MTGDTIAIKTTSGDLVLIQVDEYVDPGGYEEVSLGGDVVTKARITLDEAMSTIKAVADSITSSTALAVTPPDEVEVTFGLKVGMSAGVIVSKGTAEATFQVRLKWDRTSVAAR